MAKYRAYVTIMGELGDESLDFLDLCMELETEDFWEAKRFYDALVVKPDGVLANTLHANHPEYVRIEADYDIEMVGDDEYMDWYYIETIWAKEDYYG